MTSRSHQEETERVRADWARRGRHWDKRADELAEQAAHMNEPLIEAADIQAGQRVLDLATGAGEPALTVARLVGEAGRVFATDLVGEMMLGARRRAAAAGLRNLEFRTADMCALPDADAVFDRVICRFGIMFCPDPAAAAREAFRVLTPGGCAAYMVWGPREDSTLFAVFSAAADEIYPGADDIDFERPFSLGTPGALAAALEAGGFSAVEEHERRETARIPRGEKPFWRPLLDMALGSVMDDGSPQQRRALEDAVVRHLERYREGDDYVLTLHTRIGVGHKP